MTTPVDAGPLGSARALCLALLLSGCGEEWSPETIIEDLRVIGMKAEPAELFPGESADLSALIIDPAHPGRAVTVLWLGCDPDPYNKGRSACSDIAKLEEPGKLSGGVLPAQMRFIGVGNRATYPSSRDLFSVFDRADPRRQTGTVGQVLAIAIAEPTSGAPTQAELAALFERVASKEVKAVITLFRIKISEAPERNHNPKIKTLKIRGVPQLPGVKTRLFPGEYQLEVALEATPSSYETYPGPDAEPKEEKLTSAWYSTSGRFGSLRLAVPRVRTAGDVKGKYTVAGHWEFPRDIVPLKRTGTFWVVMRDTRGGQDWIEHPFFVCDAWAKAPEITAVRSPAARGELVVIEGKNLDGLLNVVVGDEAGLTRGLVDATTGNLEALVPGSIAPGTYPLELHSKDCRTIPGSFTLTVP